MTYIFGMDWQLIILEYEPSNLRIFALYTLNYKKCIIYQHPIRDWFAYLPNHLSMFKLTDYWTTIYPQQQGHL